MMGTARMSAHESQGVTDGYGFYRGAQNLMVCDASLFPAPIGVNPAETIQALATRNIFHFLENQKKYMSP